MGNCIREETRRGKKGEEEGNRKKRGRKGNEKGKVGKV